MFKAIKIIAIALCGFSILFCFTNAYILPAISFYAAVGLFILSSFEKPKSSSGEFTKGVLPKSSSIEQKMKMLEEMGK